MDYWVLSYKHKYSSHSLEIVNVRRHSSLQGHVLLWYVIFSAALARGRFALKGYVANREIAAAGTYGHGNPTINCGHP